MLWIRHKLTLRDEVPNRKCRNNSCSRKHTREDRSGRPSSRAQPSQTRGCNSGHYGTDGKKGKKETWFHDSHRPVLDLQPRHIGKVGHIARYHDQFMGQCMGRNQPIKTGALEV